MFGFKKRVYIEADALKDFYSGLAKNGYKVI